MREDNCRQKMLNMLKMPKSGYILLPNY